MADWESRAHLEDHFDRHHRELRTRSLKEYDASAQETIARGVRFTYIDTPTRLHRRGYFHRETSRFVVVNAEGRIISHFQTDESYVAEDLEASTYADE